MGSIEFVGPGTGAMPGRTVAMAEYVDADGVVVSIALKLDTAGNLWEVDFWKVDFSPLVAYPTPAQLRLQA